MRCLWIFMDVAFVQRKAVEQRRNPGKCSEQLNADMCDTA